MEKKYYLDNSLTVLTKNDLMLSETLTTEVTLKEAENLLLEAETYADEIDKQAEENASMLAKIVDRENNLAHMQKTFYAEVKRRNQYHPLLDTVESIPPTNVPYPQNVLMYRFCPPTVDWNESADVGMINMVYQTPTGQKTSTIAVTKQTIENYYDEVTEKIDKMFLQDLSQQFINYLLKTNKINNHLTK